MRAIANYPTTPEGIKLLKDSQVDATLQILKNMFTPEQLDKIMQILEQKMIEK